MVYSTVARQSRRAVAVIWAGLVSLVVLAQTVSSITELLWLVGGVHAVVLSALVVLSQTAHRRRPAGGVRALSLESSVREGRARTGRGHPAATTRGAVCCSFVAAHRSTEARPIHAAGRPRPGHAHPCATDGGHDPCRLDGATRPPVEWVVACAVRTRHRPSCPAARSPVRPPCSSDESATCQVVKQALARPYDIYPPRGTTLLMTITPSLSDAPQVAVNDIGSRRTSSPPSTAPSSTSTTETSSKAPSSRSTGTRSCSTSATRPRA